jgi:hypothetical protein
MGELNNNITKEDIDLKNIEISSSEEIKGLEIKERIKLMADAMKRSNTNIMNVEFENVKDEELEFAKQKILEQIDILKKLEVISNKDFKLNKNDLLIRKNRYSNIEKPDEYVVFWDGRIENSEYDISFTIDGEYYIIYDLAYFEYNHKGENCKDNAIYNFFKYLGFEEKDFIRKTDNEYCFYFENEKPEFEYRYKNKLYKSKYGNQLELMILIKRQTYR